MTEQRKRRNSFVGMRINTGSGIDPKMVDQLVELEKQPIKNIEQKKKVVNEERKLFGELKSLVASLGSSLNGLRNRSDFYKVKLESSNPEIIDGSVDNNVPVGTYEVEVKQIAKAHKILTQGFKDKDHTPVGFGYLSIELEDGKSFEVDVDPDACTLQDVANQINSTKAGAKAIVINTKENLQEKGEDSYRLLVISEKSGKEAKVFIDPDTSYLEFSDQVKGRNLEMLFEDVPIFDESNKASDIMPGLVLNAKKASPGNKVQIKIDYDLDKTSENIQKLIDNYNKVNEFIDNQFKFDQESGKAGPLSKENNLRTIKRNIQGALQYVVKDSKYQTLADVGISTDPKNGSLKYDDAKMKKALTDDYVGVAKLFIQSDAGSGVGTRMSDVVRGLQNFQNGVIPSKDREYKKILESFDKDIATKERYAAQRAENIRKRFSAVDQLITNINAQGATIQKLG